MLRNRLYYMAALTVLWTGDVLAKPYPNLVSFHGPHGGPGPIGGPGAGGASSAGGGTGGAGLWGSRTLNVSSWYAGGISYSQVVNNIINVLTGTIFYVSGAAFILGAGMLILGFVNEENKSRGKNLMIGSLVGMAVALSAKAIFNTALYFIYGN